MLLLPFEISEPGEMVDELVPELKPRVYICFEFRISFKAHSKLRYVLM